MQWKNLSVRQLQEEIISNSYEKLIKKSDYIDIIQPKKEFSIFEELKNPIIIEVDKAKVEIYINLIDRNLKRGHHNKTVGIIFKEQDYYVVYSE